MNLFAKLKCKLYGHDFKYLIRTKYEWNYMGARRAVGRQHVLHCACCRLDVPRPSNFNNPPEPKWAQ